MSAKTRPERGAEVEPTPPKPYLSPTARPGSTAVLGADPSKGEWYCMCCGARITIGPHAQHGEAEYGHATCPKRPSWMPPPARGGKKRHIWPDGKPPEDSEEAEEADDE